jgi:hypothetical protein
MLLPFTGSNKGNICMGNNSPGRSTASCSNKGTCTGNCRGIGCTGTGTSNTGRSRAG